MIRLRDTRLLGATKWVQLADEDTVFAGISPETGFLFRLELGELTAIACEQPSAIAAGDSADVWVAGSDGYVRHFTGSPLSENSVSGVGADGRAITYSTEIEAVFVTLEGGFLGKMESDTISYKTLMPAPIDGLAIADGLIYAMGADATLYVFEDQPARQALSLIAELELPQVYGLRNMVRRGDVLWLVGTDRLGEGSVVSVSVVDPEAPEVIEVDREESPFIVLATDGLGHVGTVLPQDPYTLEVPWQGRTDVVLTSLDEETELVVRPSYGELWVTQPAEGPQPLTPPAINLAQAGVEVTFTPGTYSGTPPITLTYRWLLDGVEVATGESYTPDVDAVGLPLVLEETATNAIGEAIQNSVAFEVEPPTSDLVALTAPVITLAETGVEAAFTPGTYSGTPPIVLTYRWLLDGVEVATGESYTPDFDALGLPLVLEETATNPYGDIMQDSAAVDVEQGADPDVDDWVARVIGNGGAVSGATRLAHDTFVANGKANGWWPKIDRLNTFAGVGLASALVPLKAGVKSSYPVDFSSPTFPLSEGMYAESTGINNAGTGAILTGWATGGTMGTDFSAAVYNLACPVQDNMACGYLDPSSASFIKPCNSDVIQVGSWATANYIIYSGSETLNRGVIQIVRGNPELNLWLNGAVVASTPDGGGVDSSFSYDMFVGGGLGGPGYPITMTMGGYALGYAMTADESEDFAAAWQALSLALGRPV